MPMFQNHLVSKMQRRLHMLEYLAKIVQQGIPCCTITFCLMTFIARRVFDTFCSVEMAVYASFASSVFGNNAFNNQFITLEQISEQVNSEDTKGMRTTIVTVLLLFFSVYHSLGSLCLCTIVPVHQNSCNNVTTNVTKKKGFGQQVLLEYYLTLPDLISGVAMPVPDAHARSRISLQPSKILSTSIPKRLIPRIVISNALFVFAIFAAKGWFLDLDAGVFWILMRVLASGGFGVLVWEGWTGQMTRRRDIEWSLLGTASMLQFVQYGCLFVALYRLPPPRVILFTHFSTYWFGSLFSLSSPRKGFLIALALLISITSDVAFQSTDLWRSAPGYGALFLHGMCSTGLEHTLSVLSPSLGTTFTTAASILGATIFALPLYLFRTLVLKFPPTPNMPLFSLASLPIITYSLLFLTPLTVHSVKQQTLQPQHFALSYPTLLISSFVFGNILFQQSPSWIDPIIAGLLYFGMYPEGVEVLTGPPQKPSARLVKSYLKTILSNPESRKIFYFLMLNLCYMLIQMLYGVWTNSLGLISDAIHMAFDCMAIAVGLFASVMATWEPNERYTYGYGRIETLSGFANGIFLILISIFIIFEAMQRLMEPPEMNTSQLLLVSSLGLAVNLFGMFAMGGHHHGGHSHSHSHSFPKIGNDTHAEHGPALHHTHGEGHSHSHAPTTQRDHLLVDEHMLSHSCDNRSHHHREDKEAEHCSHSHDFNHHHGCSQSQSPANNHSARSPSPHPPPSQSHTHAHETLKHSRADSPNLRASSSIPCISVHLANSTILSSTSMAPTPITPSYTFGHDEHNTKYHLQDYSHSHGHGHGHEGHSHNMRGVFLHVMADTLGSVGVIISTLLIQFYGWTGFDPIASLFIAVLIAASVVPLVIDTGKVLALDVGDRDGEILSALDELSSIEGVASYTSPRFWPKDSASLIGSIHVQVKPLLLPLHSSGELQKKGEISGTFSSSRIERVEGLLKERIRGLEELTVQVERMG